MKHLFLVSSSQECALALEQKHNIKSASVVILGIGSQLPYLIDATIWSRKADQWKNYGINLSHIPFSTAEGYRNASTLLNDWLIAKKSMPEFAYSKHFFVSFCRHVELYYFNCLKGIYDLMHENNPKVIYMDNQYLYVARAFRAFAVCFSTQIYGILK